MTGLRCPKCGYKGQMSFRKKSDNYRCSKCGEEIEKGEIEWLE